MRRKIIQIANSTQLVSLPRAWALKHNIKRGDEVEVQQQGNQIIISTDKAAEHDAVELDVSGLDRSSVIYYIRSAYRCGFNTIKVKFKNSTCRHYRTGKTKNMLSVIHREVNRLVGIDIIQQKEDFCVIKAISEPSEKDFDLLIRRVFRLMLDTYDDLITIAKKGDMVLAETIEEKHDTITKFVSCCIRLMNQKGYTKSESAFFMYHIVANIDNIVDIIKYGGRDLLEYNKKMKKDTVAILNDVKNSLAWYYDFFYKFNFATLEKLSQNRDQTKFKIKDLMKKQGIPNPDISLMISMEQILEILLDLTEARASMEHCTRNSKTNP